MSSEGDFFKSANQSMTLIHLYEEQQELTNERAAGLLDGWLLNKLEKRRRMFFWGCLLQASDRLILIFFYNRIPIISMFMYPITDMQNRYLFTVIK